MEHKPSNYIGTITLTVQQMMEVHKAIRQRLVFLTVEATDEQYPYREQDIQDLLFVSELLDEHEKVAIDEWEAEVARKEANLITDEAVEKWLSDEGHTE